MAIQFRCTGCGQAIEVDDPFANRMVACPYCQTTVQAPAATQVDAARPTANAAYPSMPMGRADGLTPLDAARTNVPIGPNPAWLCTLGLVCALMIPATLCLWTRLFMVQSETGALMQSLASQRSDQQAQAQAFREEITKWEQAHPASSVVLFVLLIGCVVIGFAASIAGLIKARTRRWQAIVGLVLCGSCVGCLGISLVVQLMGGAAGS